MFETGKTVFDKGVTGIQQRRRGDDKTNPVEPLTELTFIGTGVKCNRDPGHVHHREAGKSHAIE